MVDPDVLCRKLDQAATLANNLNATTDRKHRASGIRTLVTYLQSISDEVKAEKPERKP